MEFAIQNRPEVLQALKQIKAGQMRLGMSTHELLPQLDLITQAYVAGLDRDGQFGDAYSEQFNAGRPAYSIGVNYEIPIANRAAGARNTRRRLELRQLQFQYQTTLQTVKLEVEIAVREIDTSSQEMKAKYQAMVARSAQLEALTKRWERLPGEDVSASLALENLLVAQERLAQAESEYLQSQLTYNLAQMNLKRSTGLLLRTEGVNIGTAVECGLPTHVLSKDQVMTNAQEFQQESQGAPESISVGGIPISPVDPIKTAPKKTATQIGLAGATESAEQTSQESMIPSQLEFEEDEAGVEPVESEFVIPDPDIK